MKTKLKIIIPTSVAVILIALIVVLNIPHNLNNALCFDDSEWVTMSIVIMKNVDGQAVSEYESFTFDEETAEFAAINNVLDEYSYNMTFAKNNGTFNTTGGMTTITILGENNSSLILVNISGANIIVNGTLRRINENKIIELINKILDICGM